MVDILQVAMGLALALIGSLAVVNHPLVDKFNRVVKSMGTKQSAADIETSEVSILIGRIGGALMTLYGVGTVVGGL